MEKRHSPLKIKTDHFPYFTSGSSMFIPQKLVMNVGTIIMMFRIESRFIYIFRLLLMTESNASVTPRRTFLYVSAISIAWWLSISTSSSQSISS